MESHGTNLNTSRRANNSGELFRIIRGGSQNCESPGRKKAKNKGNSKDCDSPLKSHVRIANCSTQETSKSLGFEKIDNCLDAIYEDILSSSLTEDIFSDGNSSKEDIILKTEDPNSLRLPEKESSCEEKKAENVQESKSKSSNYEVISSFSSKSFEHISSEGSSKEDARSNADDPDHLKKPEKGSSYEEEKAEKVQQSNSQSSNCEVISSSSSLSFEHISSEGNPSKEEDAILKAEDPNLLNPLEKESSNKDKKAEEAQEPNEDKNKYIMMEDFLSDSFQLRPYAQLSSLQNYDDSGRDQIEDSSLTNIKQRSNRNSYCEAIQIQNEDANKYFMMENFLPDSFQLLPYGQLSNIPNYHYYERNQTEDSSLTSITHYKEQRSSGHSSDPPP